MKKLKIFLFISIGALIIVNGAFIFVENKYIKSDDEIVVTEIKEEEPASTEAVDITLENGAENIKANDNGQYIAYSEEGQLKIVDTKDSNVFNYEKVTDGEIAYYKWVSGEKNLLVLEKVEENGNYYLKPVMLNAKTKEAEKTIDFNKNEIQILIEDNESIENVIFATGSNTYYIQIKNENEKSDLYSVNVMNQLSKVRKNTRMDSIAVTPAMTKPIMEIDSKITLLDSKENIEIPGVERYKLIGFDKNDKIYIGSERDGKIVEIYTSELSDNSELSWSKMNFDEPLNVNDIKVDYSGKVYLLYKDKGVIKEVTTGVSVNYTGDILQSYSDGMISIKDGKVIKILVK